MSMFDRLADLESELEKLEPRLAEIYASGDQAAARESGKRFNELREIVDAYRTHRAVNADLVAARELLHATDDAEERDLWRTEVGALEDRVNTLEEELKVMLLPRDPYDDKNVIIEVRGAEGGEEGNLFAGDLYRMYVRFAEQQGWKVEMLSSQPSDMGGYKDVTFLVKGDKVWSKMKHEAGPHRVQRVPATESQGRIHTSAATVVVLPEAEEVDVHLDMNDLEIDVYRATGPGGQSVNTTDSAVRMTHKPTGLVVTCQDEKSQLQNKEKALRIMRARLLQMEQDKQNEEQSAARRSQVGGGGRSEKIRTYNYKENRVTDHRIGLTLYNLDRVLEGALGELIDQLIAADRAAKLAGDRS
jgi:peptide chain release factor 1